MSRGPAAAAVALALLVALPALPSASPAAVDPTDLPWWNRTEADQGFHMRALVQVANTATYDMADAPVAAELDLAKLMSDAGWSHVRAPGQDQLKAFELEPGSIRVVPLNDLNGPPGVRGTPKTVDPAFGPGDPRRYEAPSMHFEGSLTSPGAAFDPRTSPLITVLWRVPGVLHPGDSRPYMVYFDIVANGAHAPSDYNGTLQGEALRSLFWSSPGLRLYGVLAAASTTSVGTVTVAGLVPDTTVTVWAADAEGPKAGIFEKVAPPANQGFPENPFRIGPDSKVQAYVGSGQTKLLRIDADKPVLAFGLSTGFVPSLDGGAAGTDFVFALTQDQIWEQDTAYFIATSAAWTRIEVQQVKDGAPVGSKLQYDLNSPTADGNPYSYSRGARAAGFNDVGASNPCQPVNFAGYAPLLPLGPGLFHAHVVQGDPVMLQLQPMGGLSQVPSAMGGPAGTSFQAVLGWEDRALQSAPPPARCQPFQHKGTILASAVGAPSAVAVTSIEEPNGLQIYPPGTAQRRSPPPQPIDPAPRVSGPYLANSVLDRAVQVTATGAPIRLFAGQSPPMIGAQPHQGRPAPNGEPIYATASQAVLNGPLWGIDTGRDFAGLGRTIAFAPFPDTHVTAVLRSSDGGRDTKVFDPSPGGAIRLDDPAGGRLVGYSITATKPLLVYPTEGSAGALAGVPAFLQATPLGAEFRGHLVRIAAANGQDPLAGSTPPGTVITYTLQLTNLGRGINGADLPDDVTVSLEGVGPAWAADLDGQALETFQLSSGQTQEVHLNVRNATALHPGDAGTLLVVARSGRNPHVQDRLVVSTSIKSSYAVGMWFDHAFGALQQTKSTSAGLDITYQLVLQNLGSVQDTIELALQGLRPGWTARLTTPAGAALPEGGLLMDPGPEHARALKLTVTPPDGGGQPVQQLAVTATSKGSPAAFVTLSAITKVNLPTNVRLRAPVTFLYVAPGERAEFPVQASNDGDPSKEGAATLNLQLVSDAPPGWAAPVLYKAEKATGELRKVNPSDNEAILPSQPPLGLLATLEVPEGQGAHTLVALRLAATQKEGGQTLETFLYVLVAAQHALEIPLLPIAAAPEGGGNLTFTVAVGNHGNLNESLVPAKLSVPPQWGVGLPQRVAVARNGTASFPVNVAVPAGARPGLYNVTLRLVSEDGNATLVPLAVQVGASARAGGGSASTVLAAAGGLAEGAFPLRNEGNAPLTVTAATLPSEPWTLTALPAPFVLAPGATGTLRVAWAVPRGAPDGVGAHRVHVTLAPSGATPVQRDLALNVSVGRIDLAVAPPRTFAGAAGTLVGATIANQGDRDARGVVVQLRVEERVLDNVTVDRIPAGSASNVTLLLPAGASGPARVVVDPADAIAERDESNNVALLGAGAANPASAPAGVLLLVLLAALAAARRRT
jgi:uncharacterized membrane protein